MPARRDGRAGDAVPALERRWGERELGRGQKRGCAVANSVAVVNGSVAQASVWIADAVRAAGGTPSPQVGGQPVRFSIKLPGNIWEGKNIPYDGTAHLTVVDASQTRIDVVVSSASAFYLYLGLAVIFMFVFAHWLSPLLMLLGLVAIVWFVFQAAGSWAQEVANRVIAGLPQGAGVPGSAAPPAGSAGNPAPPRRADAGTADIPDQIKKLGELHASGVLTDDEFQAKKSELLKRL